MKTYNLIQQPGWQEKLSHHAQLGGIETSVLDNGLGRGTRIAWINTGSGLRYKVVIDRAMDIADAFYQHCSLAWLSHAGVVPPDRFSDKGTDWLRNFGGGLLTTCGLSHVGGPEQDAHGSRGLHDQISNTPAEIISIMQPDPAAGKMDMYITGLIRQTQVFGPVLELKRTISGTLGQAGLRIHDEVTNRGNTPAPHMLLYHFNFGWPLVDEGTQLYWRGNWQSPSTGSSNVFKEGHDFRKVPAPMEAHLGAGEAVAFIEAEADGGGQCLCGLHNPRLDVALTLQFQQKELPWLSNWQHWARGEYVTGLEPGTHPPIGQARARAQNTLIWLAPGECRHYQLALNVLPDNKDIESVFTSHYQYNNA